MGEDIFLALNQLFDTIGVIETGIEKIYHHCARREFEKGDGGTRISANWCGG